MLKFVLIVLSLTLVVQANVVPHPPVDNPRVPEEFIIDLDKKHEDRWRELALAKKEDFWKLINYLGVTAPYKYALPVITK